MGQIRFKLNTTFVDTGGAGKATRFLNNGNITKREGTEIALSCVFAPLALAVEGASIEEVNYGIEQSRALFETYMGLALTRVNNRIREDTIDHSPKKENLEELSNCKEKKIVTGIRFDDEVL